MFCVTRMLWMRHANLDRIQQCQDWTHNKKNKRVSAGISFSKVKNRNIERRVCDVDESRNCSLTNNDANTVGEGQWQKQPHNVDSDQCFESLTWLESRSPKEKKRTTPSLIKNLRIAAEKLRKRALNTDFCCTQGVFACNRQSVEALHKYSLVHRIAI